MLTCPDFSKCHVVVIGDLMLDRYWHGDTSRISPEAPVPVVRIEHNEERVGGAANVAVNVSALGAKATLIGVIGQDESGDTLTRLLEEKGVVCHFICQPEVRTTLKLRVLGRHQQLLRLDFEDKHCCAPDTLIKSLESVINDADVLILSDYAKGVLSDPGPIINYARSRGVIVLVDPKNADLSVYQGANLLTPNLSEFEAAVGRCESVAEIEQKGRQLVNDLNLDAVLVTRGSQGMSLIPASGEISHIPTQAREVFDITGAGDTVIGVLGASLAAKEALLPAAKLANMAAGISVGKLGTATISCAELLSALKPLFVDTGSSVFTPEKLMEQVQKRKKLGHKIVMTNGCFDILHAGHVTYLKQARALGDCLIIAVNDDDSIRRLKGESRPINSLAHRLQVLAALACVDYVVAFSEDTPEALIAKVLPDVLVKGGDYQPSQIAGGKQVLANGGSIEIIPLVPGCSTTGTLSKLNEEVVGEVL